MQRISIDLTSEQLHIKPSMQCNNIDLNQAYFLVSEFKMSHDFLTFWKKRLSYIWVNKVHFPKICREEQNKIFTLGYFILVHHMTRQLCCGSGMYRLMQLNVSMSVEVMNVVLIVLESVLANQKWQLEVGTQN